MGTYLVRFKLDGNVAPEQLSAALEGFIPSPTGIDISAIENEPLQEICAYFAEPPDEAQIELLRAAFVIDIIEVNLLPDTNWLALANSKFSPICTKQLYIHGTRDHSSVPEGLKPILIDSTMAFGTGHHGSTIGCLWALENLCRSGFLPKSMADIGCGTAIVAMSASRIWDISVVASDVDSEAVSVAATNIKANNLDQQIEYFCANGFDHPQLARFAPFDLIVANITMSSLLGLAEEIRHHSSTGSYSILSGLLHQQTKIVAAAYERLGYRLRTCIRVAEWTTLVFCAE
ncbi:MAG: 50S ribosomal protein L11 methyltransferase [Aestuariivita sp.]|nr:50S ribosomal protein L11 methyltransferase [Aestuariivita sp.]MCY4203509.1 50S ribosomal protein L11 methyltransferase [Aestuariivita sp.]